MHTSRPHAGAVIDPGSDRPLYKQLADLLRNRIATGQLAPGQKLPAEQHISDEHGVGIDTTRDALAVLRGEGLVRTVHRVGSFIRDHPERTTMDLHPGDTITTRMPTAEERDKLRIRDQGVPVFVVRRADGVEEVLPGDRIELTARDT